MRFVVSLALWILTILTTTAQPLTVVTWNLQWYPGRVPEPDESARTAQITAAKAVLKTLNPDILLLQEISDWKSAVDLCSVVPGLEVRVMSNYQERPQNLVIASKLPANSAWTANWKQNAEGMPPRGYAFAALELPRGGLLLTYCVHMKSNGGGVEKNSPIREESATQLLTHSKEMEKLYKTHGRTDVLIGGDFNSSMDDPRFRSDRSLRLLRGRGLIWAFQQVPFSKRVTIPASGMYPDGCFDHLFLSPSLKIREVLVPSAAGASDHNPVVVKIDP